MKTIFVFLTALMACSCCPSDKYPIDMGVVDSIVYAGSDFAVAYTGKGAVSYRPKRGLITTGTKISIVTDLSGEPKISNGSTEFWGLNYVMWPDTTEYENQYKSTTEW